MGCNAMEHEIFELIKPWAGVPTWHTTHPLDRGRFLRAMNNLVTELGTQIDMDAFEAALRKHADNNPAVFGNPNHWDDVIAKFVVKAELLIEYEAEKQR